MKQQYRDNVFIKGQGLIEVLVAMGIAATIIAAMTVAVTSSLSNAQFSQNQTLATQFSQEGIDVMRNIRNINYSYFSTLSGSYCLNQGVTTGSLPPEGAGCGRNINNTFQRKVTVEQNSSSCPVPSAVAPAVTNITKVVVIVAWQDGKCTSAANPFCHQAQLTSCFSDLGALVPTL